MTYRFRRLITFILALALFVAPSLASVTPVAAQGNAVTYGLVQDPANPLQVTAVAYPNFTSTGSTISSALFTILIPAGTTTSPSIPSLIVPPGSGAFNNITGLWTAQLVTEDVYNFISADPAELEGYDVYQVTLTTNSASNITTTAGQPLPLFSFTLPADCTLLPVAVLPNDGSIQQSILNNLGANFNNQMSIKVGVAPSIDMYSGNNPASSSLDCPLLDLDGDGVSDLVDADIDGDGIPNAIEDSVGGGDTDGDGIPNSEDLDSDNDGINDVLEAGGLTDADGDGQADGTDGDGDGIIDSPTAAPMDSDGDGTPDHSDLDSDNDGINDVVEGGNAAADANNDGQVDGPDTDGDGIPDAVDGDAGFGDSGSPALADSDADGLPDVVESNVADTDGDTTPDHQDADDDGDGILTINEGGADGIVGNDDADGDGIPDHLDASNGDGSGPTVVGSGDSDGDGLADAVECPAGIPCPDSDNDGTPDYLETDSDNDGVSDGDEVNILGTDPTDADSDSTNTPGTDESGNTINDGDEDFDGDGATNEEEVNAGSDPFDPTSTPDDLDGDGVSNDDETNILGTDPNDADSDSTNTPGTDENDNNISDADEDFDGDGYDNEEELAAGTDPLDPASAPGVNVAVKVLLQAPLYSPLDPSTPLAVMRDTLRIRENGAGFTGSFLPAVSPYGDGATVANVVSVFGNQGDNSVVDWVQIQLRNAADPTVIVAEFSALVQRDGDVMTVDGSTNLNVNVAPGSYYVAVTHRNHLGAMTGAPVSLSGASTTVDFTNTASDFWNSTAVYNGAEQLNAGGRYALWAGDVNDDGRIIFTGAGNDIDVIFNTVLQNPGNIFQVASHLVDGYLGTDIDLSGTTIFSGQGNEIDTILNVVRSHPANLVGALSFTVFEQLP